MSEPVFCHYPSLPPPVGVQLQVLGSEPCPYLPDRRSTLRAFATNTIPPEMYHDFMDRGFRRSGQMVYQPVCLHCRQCRSLRVPTASFRPNKSQRRAARRNGDVAVEIRAEPTPTQEKFDIYSRYCATWHAHVEAPTPDGFERFLYQSPVQTIEFEYRLAGALIAVGVCDRSAQSLSSVYFYFDPDHAGRSLGTFGALVEIDFARANDIPNFYLGYWIRDCAAMAYKARFRPAEVLGPDGVWRPLVD